MNLGFWMGTVDKNRRLHVFCNNDKEPLRSSPCECRQVTQPSPCECRHVTCIMCILYIGELVPPPYISELNPIPEKEFLKNNVMPAYMFKRKGRWISGDMLDYVNG